MEVQFGPNSVDDQNLLYKLQRKCKVFKTSDPLPHRGYSLIASASKYGVVFVASPEGILSIYYLKDLIDKDAELQHLSIQLKEKATHIAVNCDHELLAVTGGQTLWIYKIVNFQNQNISPTVSIRCDINPSTYVCSLQWNPCIQDTIAIAFFDGTLLISQVDTVQVKKIQSNARCICWSPKGKQLVVGNSEGTLCQYKPDLTPTKIVPAPNLFEGAPVETLAVYWISTYQFAVVYRNASDSSRPVVTIVNTPKAGQPTCLNYEDICYSMGSNRPWYYYLQGIVQWNLILTSSSNSMEIATLVSSDGSSWLQWCQTDEGRPELPLTDKKQENYPVGICIDTCAVHQIPWGENETLPYMPLLHVVSQTGLLTTFNIINLKREAAQICTPAQQLILPASVMSSSTPGEKTPAQPESTPAPLQMQTPETQSLAFSMAQPLPSAFQPAAAPQIAAAPSIGTTKSLATVQQPFSQAFSLAPAPKPQVMESKPKIEDKPNLIPKQLVTKPTAQPAMQTPTTPQIKDVATEQKIDLDTINRNKEIKLKSMLIKEVNDFQMELYKFMVQTREMQIQHQNNLNSLEADFDLQSLDPEKLKSECSLEELRSAVVQLKLELVRTCAVVAEARTHSEAQDLYQWTQADPLTTKRVASVKKLAYYVQTQLEQAQRALDYKWSEIATRDPQFTKPGQRMIRPILDDVYQPLVKQQEILSRQEAVLRTLRNTLKECDATPVFKSTSLLRSTPFKNKDPLSKLTKNILNMSIETQTNNEKSTLLSHQKLDALRDMLSNHKTVKIKPVNMELRKHLTAMKLNYEKNIEEKAKLKSDMQNVIVKTEPTVDAIKLAPPMNIAKIEPKSETKMESTVQQTINAFTPVHINNFNVKPSTTAQNVVRTLFTDESNEEKLMTPKIPPSSQIAPQSAIIPKQTFIPTSTTVTSDTRSVLKELLQNKTQNIIKDNNDANTFMGQKICTPPAFNFPAPQQAPSMTSNVFASKHISETSKLFEKSQAPTVASIPKNQMAAPIKLKSEEVSNPVPNNPVEIKPKVDKPITNLFALKPPSTLITNLQNFTTSEDKKIETKPLDKIADNLKENIPKINSVLSAEEKTNDRKEILKENDSKNMNTSSNVLSLTSQWNSASSIKKDIEIKGDIKTGTVETTKNSDLTIKPSTIFAAANTTVQSNAPKSTSIFGETASSTVTSIFGTPTSTQSQDILNSSNTPTTSSVSASSLFAKAVASQPTSETSGSPTKANSDTPPTTVAVGPATSVFGTVTKPTLFSPTTTTSTSIFGSTTNKSIFGSSSTAQVLSTSSAGQPSTNSVFGSPATTQKSEISTPATTSQSTNSTVTTTTAASLFGSATPTNQTSVFNTKTTTPTSLFTSTAPVTQVSVLSTQTSVFGSPTKTTQGSIFGSSTQTTQGSVFGTSAQTTQSSVFGTPQTTQPSVFGTPTQTSQASVFGTSIQTTQASIFGSPQTTQSSVFGNSAQATQTSIFGTPTQVTQASVFGTPPATSAQSTSLFGGAESNLFAAASISTTKAASPTSGGNIFSGSPSSSAFGASNTNVFGGKAAFGQSNPTAASIFGGAASFGQKQNTNLWGSGNTNSGAGFGQTTNTQSSIFGSGSGGSFSAPSTGQPFSSPQAGPFSGGDSKPSVFGSPQQQSTPAFGGSPVFGSQPVFGQSSPGFGSSPGSGFGTFSTSFNKSPSNTGFGAPAAFGGGASFGGSAFGSSPGKVFGGSSPGFGASAQSNSTFENLATQNTLTFGNLAQQSNQQPAQSPSFKTSPSFTGWRG